MTGSFDILIVGIGGQGTILASNILGEACLLEERHVKGAETHGMAQRGGSVETPYQDRRGVRSIDRAWHGRSPGLL